MSLHSTRTSTLSTSLQRFYSFSVEMPRASRLMPTMTLCPTMKILLKLTSMQCGLPSLSTTKHLTKLPKDYETFSSYERPRNQPIWNSRILRHNSTSLISTYLYSQDPLAITSMMPTCSTPFRNVFQIGTIPTLPQTPQPKT
jgi:hypothetical protein